MKTMSLIVLAALAAPAHAQFAKPDDAIKYRQSAMALTGAHFGRLGAMANGRVPFDAKAAADNAEVVALVSKLAFTGFTDGSGQGNTRAKAEVWGEADKFKTAASRQQEEAARLLAAAKTGNLDNLKAAFGETAKTCKGCHDNFRRE
ncbi:cytochrome c [Aquincola sp. S2]|uniref:Cytochrome c n=1 Tax=Pseudaquabacterium terrae TaxID=2732868 RepID=A0ABX2ETQ3_9BURK|nr:cytochrome c [Aquabacterium terrae]NRF72094.1 cytochrome c [Aquabacterium terrae]